MRKVIAAEFVTLDGYIAGPNGEMDWGPVDLDPNDLKPEWDTILLGRVTYQLWLNIWPETPPEANPQADFINNAPKVVFSRTLGSAPWGRWKNARLVKDNVPEMIAELKHQPGGNMAILGSATLVQSFAALGLIDEYLLLVFPVIIGGGKPLFSHRTGRQKVELVEAKSIRGGIVVLRYRPAAQRFSDDEVAAGQRSGKV